MVSNLGVNETQATGGAGLLLGMAKEKLGGGDFSQIAAAIPGIDAMLSSAPTADTGGGLMGALGKVASGLGGSAGGIGDLAELAGGFSKLDLSADMIGKFVPVVLQFVEQNGGDQVRQILASVLAAR